MQVELLEAKTETSRPFGAAEVAAMSAGPLPARVWPTASSGSMCGLGFCPFLVLRHEIPAAGLSAHQQSAGDRSPRVSDEALLVAIEADLEAAPWRARDTEGLGSASGLSWHPCFPQAGAPGDAREQPALAPSLPPRGGNPHVGEIITHAPNLSGARTAFGCSRWTTLGLGIHRHRALERRVRRLACVQARRPLRRPSADLHGACEAVCLDLRRCGAGAGLADGSRLPVSVGPLHQPDQVLGHPAVLRLRRTAPDQRRRQQLKEQIIHGRIYRNIAELRNAVRGFVEQYNAQWIVEKNGYLSPAQARQAWHTAMSLRPAA